MKREHLLKLQTKFGNTDILQKNNERKKMQKKHKRKDTRKNKNNQQPEKKPASGNLLESSQNRFFRHSQNQLARTVVTLKSGLAHLLRFGSSSVRSAGYLPQRAANRVSAVTLAKSEASKRPIRADR